MRASLARCPVRWANEGPGLGDGFKYVHGTCLLDFGALGAITLVLEETHVHVPEMPTGCRLELAEHLRRV
jgi:hypothetical protein